MTIAKNVAVIGAGAWGTALAMLLARNGHVVRLWGRDSAALLNMQAQSCNPVYLPDIPFPANLHIATSAAEALAAANLVVIAVPSHAFSACLQQLQPYLTAQSKIVSASKGFDTHTGTLLHETAQQCLPAGASFAVLSGPSFAGEVARGLPTAITLACVGNEAANQLRDYFHSKTFRVYTTTDIIGVQVGGAVKNVLAVAAGMNDGLGFGMNARAALITRGLQEMLRLAVAMGGMRETMMGLAGLGDLILTCNDNQSRNRRFGILLGQGNSIEFSAQAVKQTVEALNTAELVYQQAKHYSLDMPICTEVRSVLRGDRTPRQSVDNLLGREPKCEG